MKAAAPPRPVICWIGLILFTLVQPPVFGCTTAVISGRATVDGRPILWKNRDAPHRHNEVVILSDGRYRVLAVVNADQRKSVWMGVNSAGLCIENALSKDLRSEEKTNGPGNGALMKRVLQNCATVSEVCELLEQTNSAGRSTNANFGVIDAEGGAAMIEAGPNTFACFDANDPQVAPHGYIVRTNFATTARQLAPTPSSQQVGDIYSSKRFQSACQRLHTFRDEGICVKHLIRNLARDLSDYDAAPFPGSINAVGGELPERIDTDRTISRNTTVSAAVFHGVRPGENPAFTTMWTILGDPKFSVAVPCWANLEHVADPLSGDDGGEIGEVAITLRSWCMDRDGKTVRAENLRGIWQDVWRVEDQVLAETNTTLETHRRQGEWNDELNRLHRVAADRAYRALLKELDDAKQVAFDSSADRKPARSNQERLANWIPDELRGTKHSLERIRVAVYDDQGVGRSINDLLAALESMQRVMVQRIDADDIRSGALASFDVLIHPGGSGGKQGRHLGESGRDAIRHFVRRGGGFIGICAGAYLASSHYEWSLNLLNAKVFDTPHWDRGTDTVTIELTESGRHLLQAGKERTQIFYGQGPLLLPGNDPDLPRYETLAVYRTTVAKRGAPRTAMQNTTAIARGDYGNGRVLCFSPHPEKTSGLERFVHRAVLAVIRENESVFTSELIMDQSQTTWEASR